MENEKRNARTKNRDIDQATSTSRLKAGSGHQDEKSCSQSDARLESGEGRSWMEEGATEKKSQSEEGDTERRRCHNGASEDMRF